MIEWFQYFLTWNITQKWGSKFCIFAIFCNFLSFCMTLLFVLNHKSILRHLFSLSCDILWFEQTSSCILAPLPLLASSTKPPFDTQTHTRLRILSECSAEAPGLSSPHGGAVTGGGQAYLGPRPLPQPPALAPGAGRQMPFRNLSAECFCGQSV